MLTINSIIRSMRLTEQSGRGRDTGGVLRRKPLPPAKQHPQRKSRALARFKPGLSIELGCYKKGCGAVRIPVTLGEDETKLLHPTFHGPDEIRWKPGTPVKAFLLAKRVHCPHCTTLFESAIIVSNGWGRRPTIFGYEPEPI